MQSVLSDKKRGGNGGRIKRCAAAYIEPARKRGGWRRWMQNQKHETDKSGQRERARVRVKVESEANRDQPRSRGDAKHI